MQIEIVSFSPRSAELVQQGLKCEGLHIGIHDATKSDRIPEHVLMSDGLFIHGFNLHSLESVANSYRKMKDRMPIIVLAQRDAPILRALVNEGKIDAYFVRPFAYHRIAAEMKYSIFRIKEAVQQSTYILRDIQLDVLKREVKCRGKSVYLRNKEFSLLHFMMLHPGRLLSRSTILDNVWDCNVDVVTNTVDVHVSQLRKKIESHLKDKYIHTVPCSGYIFQ